MKLKFKITFKALMMTVTAFTVQGAYSKVVCAQTVNQEQSKSLELAQRMKSAEVRDLLIREAPRTFLHKSQMLPNLEAGQMDRRIESELSQLIQACDVKVNTYIADRSMAPALQTAPGTPYYVIHVGSDDRAPEFTFILDKVLLANKFFVKRIFETQFKLAGNNLEGQLTPIYEKVFSRNRIAGTAATDYSDVRQDVRFMRMITK